MLVINSCVRLNYQSRLLKLRFLVVKSTLAHTRGIESLIAFLHSRVRYTKVNNPSAGLIIKNRMRFMNHGAVALCKRLQKTSKKLILATDQRNWCLIDELHSLADTSPLGRYKGRLTARGSLLPKNN
jgi:hypothetical protein